MVAYFSSKLTKQIQAALAVTLLLICMMGTHWIGFAHRISHASVAQQNISQTLATELTPAYSHSSDVCHLFDALTLAGFLPGPLGATLTAQIVNTLLISPTVFLPAQVVLSAYQSRAPPNFIL
jgi:hypothetical protein